MPFLLMLLPILKKFFVPLIIIFALMGVILYAYHKGKDACESKMNQIIAEDQIRLEQEIERIMREGSKIRDRIKGPLTDKQASCILSNNPFKVECTK